MVSLKIHNIPLQVNSSLSKKKSVTVFQNKKAIVPIQGLYTYTYLQGCRAQNTYFYDSTIR